MSGGFIRILTAFQSRQIAVIAVLACTWSSALHAQNAIPSAAVFDFELFDTSLEGEVKGENPDEQQRLVLISDLLRRLLSESGRFRVVDVEPAAAQIADAGEFRGCNGCDVAIAKDLGAEMAITGVVQKVSNLILNINIYVRETESGKLSKVMSADIRGNTDDSWVRGVSWLVRNRLLAE